MVKTKLKPFAVVLFLYGERKDTGNSTYHKTIPCKQFKNVFSKEICEIRRIYSTNFSKIFNSKIHASIHAQNLEEEVNRPPRAGDDVIKLEDEQ